MTVGARFDDSTIAGLRGRLRGSLALPGEAAYVELTRAWNTTACHRPALAAGPADADDVAAVVRFAADHGLGVAAQSSGHGAAGTVGDDAILISTRALDGVVIDAGRRVARVGAGATWGAVTSAAEPHGLMGLAGTAPSVGVVGYVLHGGIGWLARGHGLASAGLLAVEYVDASGQRRRADEAHDADALWAFRGGAGVGVVTAVEVRLVPQRRVHAGARTWPLEHAPAVLERWLAWTDGLPTSITSLIWAFQMPDVPAMPPTLRGRAVIGLGVCGTDLERDPARIERLLSSLPAPLLDDVGERSPSRLGEMLAGPPDPVPSRGDGWLIARPAAAVAAEIVRASGLGAGGPLMGIELRHLGGRAAAAGVDGALTELPGEFLVDAIGAAPGPEQAADVDAACAAMRGAAGPANLGRAVAGFRGGHVDAPGALDAASRARLLRLREARDGSGRLRRAREVAA